ncbi:MAG: cytochrome c biogenesis heme-transporting ATPase CcmA [Methylophagaceae bacterium]
MTLKAKNIGCTRGLHKLFTGLSLSLNTGQILLIEGNNGSGKSTLLKILAGLRHPDDGEVTWNGQPIEQVSSEYSQQVVWLSHRNGINDSLTAKENIEVSASLSKSNDIKINDILEQVGLQAYANIPVRQFSVGMKRRLALSRLLTKKAKLWLLDEPQGALDKTGMALLEKLVEQHVTRAGMVVMSSHHDVKFHSIPVYTLNI